MPRQPRSTTTPAPKRMAVVIRRTPDGPRRAGLVEQGTPVEEGTLQILSGRARNAPIDPEEAMRRRLFPEPLPTPLRRIK